MMVNVNYLAVVVAAVASMAVGFLWYGPMLFGNLWMKLMGYTKESLEKAKADMNKTYALSFVGALVMAYVLAHVVAQGQAFYQTEPLMTGLMAGFWSWLGFIAPVQMTEVLFSGKKWKLFALNTGYQLVSVLVMGVIIALWK